MSAADLPFASTDVQLVVNGVDISQWVSDVKLDQKDDVSEFQGMGGSPKKRLPQGSTRSFTFTCAIHPTTTFLRGLYSTSPKPLTTVALTEFAGSTRTFDAQLSSLTDNYKSGSVISMDVEATVVGPIS